MVSRGEGTDPCLVDTSASCRVGSGRGQFTSMPREVYSDQIKRDAVAMYEDHSHVSLKAAVKELGTDLGSRGVGWEGVGKQGGRRLDSEQGESGCVRVARTLSKLDTLKERSLLVARLKAS